MKVLNSQNLHQAIEDLNNKTKSQMEQVETLKNAVLDFSNLDDSFAGQGGTAIRSFYQDWHVPFLSFYYSSLKNYQRVLKSIKEASSNLESNPNGFIHQGFLEEELTTGVNKAKVVTTELVDDVNESLNRISDILMVQGLNDDLFHLHIQRANQNIQKTVEDLSTFDTDQTKELNSVDQDIKLMKNYLTEIQGMFKSGELNLTDYNSDQFNEKTHFNQLQTSIVENKTMEFGNLFTSPFDLINKKMSFGDTLIAGYQAASTLSTLALVRKLKVHYLGSKPNWWQRFRGKYDFTVKTDSSWTSKGKHSSKLAKAILDFSRSAVPSNPIMKDLHKFVSSYESPAHLLKHVAGFPKNMSRVNGNDFIKGNIARMSAGTKELVGKAVTNRGFAQVGRNIPGVGTGISTVANTGEFTAPENKDKSLAEKFGRAAGGTLADMGAIAIGAKIGATIGSVGGPVGVIVGGSLGALAGGLASSKIGDVAKDIGGKIGKETGEFAMKLGTSIKDTGGKVINSISSWWN